MSILTIRELAQNGCGAVVPYWWGGARRTLGALEKLIRGYTREVIVRRLEQMLGRVIRKVAVKLAEGAARTRGG
jgi:hypothetical protein